MTVMSEAPLINVENPNTTTTLTGKAIQDLPNPGGDMTYPAQFAPGALINTAGSSNDFVGGQNGYGNVQFNGLPALSNAYIVDGLETNDPLTNLNSGLATNLVLGLNSIEEVTVNTTSYAVDQGRYGASQINYITKSGTNTLHGNLYELWNGSRMNAANFFTNATAGNRKPRSTVNHFGGSLGGPIRPRQAILLRRFRANEDRPADRQHGHAALDGFPELRSGATAKGGSGHGVGNGLPGRPGAGSFLHEDVLALSEHGWNGAAGAGMSRSTRMAAWPRAIRPTETGAPFVTPHRNRAPTTNR